jgi:hypothetical protein
MAAALLLLVVVTVAFARDHFGHIDRTSKLLINASSHPLSGDLARCDIRRSALTRTAADGLFFGQLRQLLEERGTKTEFSESCPLLEQADVFRNLHHQRSDHSFHGESCCLCGKTFEAPHLLDRHMIRRHSDRLDLDHSSCLSDFCDILQCESFDWKFKDRYESLPCFPRRMLKLKSLCYETLALCMPLGAPQDVEIDVNSTIAAICNTLTCDTQLQHAPWSSINWSYFGWAVVALVCAVLLIMAVFRVCVALSQSWRRWRARKPKAMEFRQLPSKYQIV